MLAENATSPIGCAAKVSQAYRPIGVWSRAEWAHGRKLHPPSVSKSDSGRACVCESGWAVIHRGRRPSCLMKVQNHCVTAASATHSFFFSSTLLSAFLVRLRCSKPERKASHQHAVTREHWMEVVFGAGTACLEVKHSRSAAWTNPGSAGENIYTYARRELKRRVCFQSQDCLTQFALKHLRLIFQATIWGQSGWQKTASYHPFFCPVPGHIHQQLGTNELFSVRFWALAHTSLLFCLQVLNMNQF